MNNEFRALDSNSLTRFITEKTDYSNIKPLKLNFDVIFMSYHEKEAETHYQTLKKFVPNAKRVNGVKGIINAYNACRELAETPFFYIVEGDSLLCNDFDFKVPNAWIQQLPELVSTKSLVNNSKAHKGLSIAWCSANPVNGEIHPHSPISLTFKPDKPYELLEKGHEADSFKVGTVCYNIASINAFNSSPYDAWKAGFRMGNKIMFRLLNRNDPADKKYFLEKRLHHWESVGYDRLNGKYCIEGVKLGKSMAKKHDTWWLEYRKTSQDYNNLKNIFIKEYGTEYYNN